MSAWPCTSRKTASYVLLGLGLALGSRCPEEKAQRYMQHEEQTSEQDVEPQQSALVYRFLTVLVFRYTAHPALLPTWDIPQGMHPQPQA